MEFHPFPYGFSVRCLYGIHIKLILHSIWTYILFIWTNILSIRTSHFVHKDKLFCPYGLQFFHKNFLVHMQSITCPYAIHNLSIWNPYKIFVRVVKDLIDGNDDSTLTYLIIDPLVFLYFCLN